MSFVLTPAAFSPSITSSISSLVVLAPGLPTGFILMPTTSPGSKKRAPGLDRVVGAGQLLHAAVDGRLDRLAALLALADHRRVAGLDHPAGIGAGDAEGLAGLRRPPRARRPRSRRRRAAGRPPRPRPGTGDDPCRRRDKACSWSIPSCKSREWPESSAVDPPGRRDGMVGRRLHRRRTAATTRPMITPGSGCHNRIVLEEYVRDPRIRGVVTTSTGPAWTRVSARWVGGGSRWAVPQLREDSPPILVASRIRTCAYPSLGRGVGSAGWPPFCVNLPRPA